MTIVRDFGTGKDTLRFPIPRGKYPVLREHIGRMKVSVYRKGHLLKDTVTSVGIVDCCHAETKRVAFTLPMHVHPDTARINARFREFWPDSSKVPGLRPGILIVKVDSIMRLVKDSFVIDADSIRHWRTGKPAERKAWPDGKAFAAMEKQFLSIPKGAYELSEEYGETDDAYIVSLLESRGLIWCMTCFVTRNRDAARIKDLVESIQRQF